MATMEKVVAKKHVPGREPVSDGKALGVALAAALKFGHPVVVNLDGLRMGTVSSSFINMAIEVVLKTLPGFDVRQNIRWEAKDKEIVEIANRCTEYLR